jgi:hypothetical protein
VTPEPGASRADELRQTLLEHTRFVVTLETSVAQARKTEARLIRLLVDELRQPRGAGRPRKLFALDLEEGISAEHLEQVRQVIRLSARGVSPNKIAEEVGISWRQVAAILGDDEQAA